MRSAPTMRALIATHNRLNGFRFVVLEFGLIVLLVVPFGLYYALHARWLLALIALGIICNCAVVLTCTIRSLISGESDVGLRSLYTDQETRQRVAQEHPNLFRDTMLLVVAAVLPFVLSIWTGRELVQGDSSSGGAAAPTVRLCRSGGPGPDAPDRRTGAGRPDR